MLRGKDHPQIYLLNVVYTKRRLKEINPTWTTKEIETRVIVLGSMVELMMQDRLFYNAVTGAARAELKSRRAKP